MPTAVGQSAVLTGTAPPLTKARLLAALLPGAMSAADARTWVDRHQGVDAVAELVAAGSVRRTADGGLALDHGRRASALGALDRDLRV
ncbi:hypothetical protein [Cellulomonas sp. NPDC058312]|uniref:hypothetical protein n=1 Tax=Cellulomonas sp. NPDC058312 TaxID=3346441 RepID=UPI0036EC4C17